MKVDFHAVTDGCSCDLCRGYSFDVIRAMRYSTHGSGAPSLYLCTACIDRLAEADRQRKSEKRSNEVLAKARS